ncbi:MULTISPECIES: hypothetical protein [Amycolatopsis]|uniref:Uncharacterized protein n=1 Tax=Amycolatopsis dendrobii TaxID=2760662 RepID=A0A7W3ZD63_9PSEU|nr:MULTISPECIES: hypothetical protein [Amycolatopsis]MBB1157256.1 hypothetical protein [Amycolatopsis dendrobii]UKD59357.1 hypothetical protein L3Q65_22395 [Amycolatopsis sp. FU40]
MDAVVQWVRTSWTKKSRGGAEAARRNAVPIAFPLPALTAPFTHVVRMSEETDFEPRSGAEDEAPSPWDSTVRFREADGLLRVEVKPTPHGNPRRFRRPPAHRLARGEWLRWQVNYRLTGVCCGEWHYRLDTLNVAYGPVSRELFLGTPSHLVDELGILR